MLFAFIAALAGCKGIFFGLDIDTEGRQAFILILRTKIGPMQERSLPSLHGMRISEVGTTGRQLKAGSAVY